MICAVLQHHTRNQPTPEEMQEKSSSSEECRCWPSQGPGLVSLFSGPLENTSVSTLGERTNENPILAVLFISDVKGTERSEQDATLF